MPYTKSGPKDVLWAAVAFYGCRRYSLDSSEEETLISEALSA